jgi:hypothetical protein
MQNSRGFGFRTSIFLLSTLIFLVAFCGTKPQKEPNKKLMQAIRFKESSNLENPPDGDNGHAVGPYQIWPIMVETVNERLPKNKQYTLEDRRNLKKSEEMFVIYTNRFTPDWNPEDVAARWNGGPKGLQAKDPEVRERIREYTEEVMEIYQGL